MRSAVGLFICRGSWGMEKHVPHWAQRDFWDTKRSALGKEEESSFVGRTWALEFCSVPLSTATLSNTNAGFPWSWYF